MYAYKTTKTKETLPEPSIGSPSIYISFAAKTPITSPPKLSAGCPVIRRCIIDPSLGPHRAIDPRAPGHDDNGADGPAANGAVLPGVSPGDENWSTQKNAACVMERSVKAAMPPDDVTGFWPLILTREREERRTCVLDVCACACWYVCVRVENEFSACE